jgi:hypothetical protein
MRTLSIAVLSLLLGSSVGHAGRALVYARLSLVQAQCGQLTIAPCAPAFAFKSGVAALTTLREPAPTCPRTGLPEEAKAGTVTLTGVTKDGAPFTGTLPTETVLKPTFGANPASSCVLAGIPSAPVVGVVGDLTCRNGKCRARLKPPVCLPAECADVPVTAELVSFKVLDGSGNPEAVVATPGTFIAPKR